MKEYIVWIDHSADGSVVYHRTLDEIVRCKDCRYFKTGENESENWSICARNIVYPYVDVGPNDYCSFGERKTDA